VSALPIGWYCQLSGPGRTRTRIDALAPNDGLRWTAIFALYPRRNKRYVDTRPDPSPDPSPGRARAMQARFALWLFDVLAHANEPQHMRVDIEVERGMVHPLFRCEHSVTERGGPAGIREPRESV